MSRLQAQPRPGNPAHEPIPGGNIPTEVPPREPDEFPDQGPTGPRTPYPVERPRHRRAARPGLRARLSAGRPLEPDAEALTMQQPNQPIGPYDPQPGPSTPGVPSIPPGHSPLEIPPAQPSEAPAIDPDRAPSPGPSTPATPPAAPEPQPRA